MKSDKYFEINTVHFEGCPERSRRATEKSPKGDTNPKYYPNEKPYNNIIAHWIIAYSMR
jgi:hypothetical protein